LEVYGRDGPVHGGCESANLHPAAYVGQGVRSSSHSPCRSNATSGPCISRCSRASRPCTACETDPVHSVGSSRSRWTCDIGLSACTSSSTRRTCDCGWSPCTTSSTRWTCDRGWSPCRTRWTHGPSDCGGSPRRASLPYGTCNRGLRASASSASCRACDYGRSACWACG